MRTRRNAIFGAVVTVVGALALTACAPQHAMQPAEDASAMDEPSRAALCGDDGSTGIMTGARPAESRRACCESFRVPGYVNDPVGLMNGPHLRAGHFEPSCALDAPNGSQ